MYEQLYRYFLRYKRLGIPGVGTFLLERKPAETDFVNKQIRPPSYHVTLHAAAETPAIHFFKWLAGSLEIPERDVIIRFNDFAFEIKKQIGDGDSIDWQGMGKLSRGFGNKIKFEPAEIKGPEQAVAAEKVIREKAEHMVRVGEDQKTSVEMKEFLTQPRTRKSQWWITAMALGLLAFMFIAWYFSEHGVDVTSTSNNMKLAPAEATVPYQSIH